MEGGIKDLKKYIWTYEDKNLDKKKIFRKRIQRKKIENQYKKQKKKWKKNYPNSLTKKKLK